jgi:hypothetical protein
LGNHFTSHDLCDKSSEWQLEVRVQAMLEAIDNDFSERLRPCYLQKLINSLKLIVACGTDSIPN